jgi:adenine-specific DNA-methyltransferase
MKDQSKIINEVIKTLKKNDSYVVEGKLNKTLIVDHAFKMDKGLLSLLLNSKYLKDFFFVDVDKTLVFDKILFQEVITNKQLLDDSFTKYKKEIGLNIEEPSPSFNNVVLNWPYKDCLLEGGQSNEFDNREEVFWNEIISRDEIDLLLKPKVFASGELVSQNTEKKFLSNDEDFFDNSNNLLIHGNNLIVAHTLLEKFANSIKLVYLDPPYNTPGEANTFSYNNSFNHSTWLTFMKNRISVSKSLLKREGILCIAIDDNEYAYVKVMCDEIFGRENFLGSVVVQIKKEGRTDNQFFSTSHDYMIFYAKDKTKAKINDLPITEDELEKFSEIDSYGNFRWRDFIRTGGNSTPKERPKQFFGIYVDQSSNKIIGIGDKDSKNPPEKYNPLKIFIKNSDNGEIEPIDPKKFQKNSKVKTFYPINKNGGFQVWRWSSIEKIFDAIESDEIQFINGKIKIKARSKLGIKPTTMWYDPEYNATAHGTNLLKKLFEGKKVFSYPKSVFTMQDLLQITLDKNDTVLDLFAGSATTAHALCNLNKNDGGKRNFILVEQMSYCLSTTKERIKKVLNTQTENFIFLNLHELNAKIFNRVNKIKTHKDAEELIDELNGYEYLNVQKDIEGIFNSLSEIKNTNIEVIKSTLIDILDKNQMYLSYSEINDKKHKISNEIKKLNNLFYKK